MSAPGRPSTPPEKLTELTELVGTLHDRFGAATEAAARVREAFRRGDRPEPDDLDVIGDAVADFDSVRAQVDALRHETTTPTGLTGLTEALDAATTDAVRAERVRAMIRLVGPDALGDIVRQVRDAVSAGRTDGLDLLAELIEVCADETDDGAFLRIDELTEQAREHLPRDWRPLITATLRRRLWIEDEPASVSESDVEESVDRSTEPAEPIPPEPMVTDTIDAERTLTALAPEPPKATAESIDAATAEAAALRAGRFGLAAWLREAAGHPETEGKIRRVAALAQAMSVFAGRLSAELDKTAGDLGPGALADDPAGRLLGWAAAARAGLVHPTPESTRLLEELIPASSAHPGLAAYGEAFIRAAHAGAYLVPGATGRPGPTSEQDRRNAAQAARRFLDESPYRTIKFAPATDVWRALLRDDAKLGRLLATVADDDFARVDDVAGTVTELRSAGAVDHLIDTSSRRASGKRRQRRIDGAARHRLLEMIEDALDPVSRWVSAARETNAPAGASADWLLRAFAALREVLDREAGRVDAELNALAARDAPVIAAAAEAVQRTIGDIRTLLDRGMPRVEEPRAAHLLNADLLSAPDIEVHANTLTPYEPPTVARLAPVALTDVEDWSAAFDARAARMDHDGTRAILGLLEADGDGTAEQMRLRRDDLVSDARAELGKRCEEIRDRIARWRRDGALAEDDEAHAEGTLSALSAAERTDFGRIGRALDALEAELACRRDALTTDERDRTRELAESGQWPSTVLTRVEECVDRGDLTTAREFIAQIKAGHELPTTAEKVDHFHRFFPDFPRTFANLLARTGARARRNEDDGLIIGLMEAIRAGRDVADPDLDALLTRAGIAIPELRNSRREESREGLRQWRAIGQGPKTSANVRTALASVLRMIGLEGEQRDGPHDRERTWIELDGPRTGEAVLPSFGSWTSPSGDRLRLLLVWGRPGPQRLVEWLKDEPEDRTVLVFYFGVLSAEDRRGLAATSRERPEPVMGVLDDAAMSYLACMPEATWANAVRLMAPFTSTNPYVPTGDVPEEMFYGRAAQLKEITERGGSSFVYGGRQLGKSALLRKAERQVGDRDPHHLVIFEVIQNVGKSDPLPTLWSRLARELTAAGVTTESPATRDDVCKAIRAWVDDDARRQILIFLDEADRFLSADAEDASFENVTALRDLMTGTDRRVKVVFAGLHQTARFQSLPNQPLAHLGTPVAVGPLEPQHAFDLLVKPLATLGFRLPDALAARVTAQANNAPALVQLFAEALLNRLWRMPVGEHTLPYTVTHEDVEAVWQDRALVRGFRDRFEWTLNLDKRYKVIAYVVALHALIPDDEELDVGRLRAECLDWWPYGFAGCSRDGFRGLLDECVNLGVLGVDDDGYRLRTPHILRLLGDASSVYKELDNADSFESPDFFDAHSYRARYQDGPQRSPLTGGQLAPLLRPEERVRVITGSRALHVEWTVAALEAAVSAHGAGRLFRVGTGHWSFAGAVEHARKQAGHTIIALNPDDRPEKPTERIRAAKAALAEPERGSMSFVLVASPEQAPAWARVQAEGAELVELRRFDQACIRQWMQEETYGFGDDAGQTELLSRTGGWPTLIGRIVRALGERGADTRQALESIEEYLGESAEEFVSSTGVRACPPLAAAWRSLVAEDAPDTAGGLAELLELYGEEVPDLGPKALAAVGFTNTAELVEALRVLQVLVPATDGRMACEPVLASATRRLDAAT